MGVSPIYWLISMVTIDKHIIASDASTTHPSFRTRWLTSSPNAFHWAPVDSWLTDIPMKCALSVVRTSILWYCCCVQV